MHEKNIALLCDEADRLLQLNINLLRQMVEDTPFADERVIEQHIEAGISLCDAVNFLVEKYALVLPTSRDSAPVPALS